MSASSTAPGVSVIIPAYRAEKTLSRAVASVLDQTHRHFEILVIADDNTDYSSVLGRAGITDPRLRFLATGAAGSGSSATRNAGLDAARNALIAILDADDAFLPDKLAEALLHLEAHGIVSSALRIESADGQLLRTVGTGPDRVLDPGTYKFVNISMDSMLVYNRVKVDPRYDTSFPCLTDIAFLLRLWEKNASVFHLGTPLHVYTKQPASVSNRPGTSAPMIETKKRLIDGLETGTYPLAAPGGKDGLLRFYTRSLEAERSYEARQAEEPNLLFEDHLEPFLTAPRP